MKTGLLFSGGWDSAAAYFASKVHIDGLVFISYGQIYEKQELEHALKFALDVGGSLIFTSMHLKHDQERRNFFFLMEMKRLGFDRVVIGSRNVHPLFDRYKDSNWVSLKRFAKLAALDVHMPVTGWRKQRVVDFVRARYRHPLYNCYHGNMAPDICMCSNCREMRSLE